ncbi:MAG TPA: DUF1906 domain-containing protein [Jatrophihabitans sp.]|nr:DUF1906 domain-containing protein [Jatrophihabitans sp.]
MTRAVRSRRVVRAVAALALVAGCAVVARVPAASAAGTVKLTGYGADSCTAPSEAQMRAFWTNTPYSYWGVYIGGADRACAQPNLTRTWVSHVLTMGWDLLPIWVGRQNPCTPGQAVYFSRNTTTAYAQGKAEALAAYYAWRAVSSVGHVPIDIDIEAPSVNTASCRAATKAFVDGWVAQLHVAPAQVAGVYTSVCGGYIDDFAHLRHVPDFIDAADWDYVPSTGALSCVPANHWIYHQRHKQYRGGHNATYNHVTLNIDSRCADGAVYGVRSQLSASHSCARTAAATTSAAATTLAAAAAPVSWHGARWRAGGPLDAQLQHSAVDGWRAGSVDGTPIPTHEVSPGAATIGTPMVMRDGSLLVPVTRHDASRSSVVLYSTTDGRHFTRRASAPVDAALGAGVAVPTATSDGSRVLVLDPAGTATSWSPQGTTRFRTAGLPSGAAAVQLGSGATGQAVVTTGTCSRGKTDCTVRDRVYRTADGGRSWAG